MGAPAGCPWRGVLDGLPGVRRLQQIFRAAHAFGPAATPPGQVRIHSLQEWATIMTSAICHVDRLGADDLDRLSAPFSDLLPGLRGVLAGSRGGG